MKNMSACLATPVRVWLPFLAMLVSIILSISAEGGGMPSASLAAVQPGRNGVTE